jgi:hypothetical protein
MPEELLLFAGSASRKLGGAIADYLGCPLGASETLKFSEGNLFVRVLENVRGRDVYVVQATGFPANDNFMELLFWIDAFKRASAASVTAVMPYFSYAKGDKKDEPRVSIRARVCADAMRRPASTVSSPWTSMRPRYRASSRSPSTTSTPSRFSVTPSPPKVFPIWWWSPLMPDSPRRRANGPNGLRRHWPSPTSAGWTTRSQPRSWTSSETWRAGRP